MVVGIICIAGWPMLAVPTNGSGVCYVALALLKVELVH